MCNTPPILLPRSSGMQVPSLKGFSIPQLEPSPLQFAAELRSLTEISRPSLSRINTDAAREQIAQYNASTRIMGHRHSRSLDVPSQPASVSTSDHLNSATSDSFLPPWSSEIKPSHELPLSPLPGPYISQSRRKNSGAVTGTTSVPPLMTSLAPILGPPSPAFDSSEDTADSEGDVESEDIWDLVPYDISWGSAYYGYKEGTLPGPEGKCIFLRSPTPLKYQRTGQACEKCRERKAKCSGARPSCARCAMRGLACVYAPDLKRAKSEDLNNESGTSAAPTDSADSSPAGQFEASNTGRVRRNTDCGSHGAQVHAQSSRAALRRRHSTIGLSVSPPLISRGLGFRASREPRLARRAARGSNGQVFLGGSLDSLIAFPRDCAEDDDDLSVSESNRLSYHTSSLLQDAGSLATESFCASTNPGCGESVNNPPLHGQRLRFTQALVDKSIDSMQYSPATGSLPTDLLEERQSCLDFLSPMTSNNSNAMYGVGYAHHAPGTAETEQFCPTLTAGNGGSMDGCSAVLDYEMSDLSRIDLMPGGETIHWPCDPTTQHKLEMADFPIEMDSPHIAVLSHCPDFYHFNHHEDTTAWFVSDDY